jgi:type II secretory pathway component PulJ
MKRLSFWNDERGFTIQELMVNVIIGSLLISFSFSLFLFGQKLFLSWQKKSAVQTSVFRTMNTVSHDILNSQSIEGITDSSFILMKGNERKIRYEFKPGSARRNGVPINSVADVDIELRISAIRNYQGEQSVAAVRFSVVGKTKFYSYKEETEVAIPGNSKQRFASISTYR